MQALEDFPGFPVEYPFVSPGLWWICPLQVTRKKGFIRACAALIEAQHGPVRINKNGKPVAVLISANEFTQLQAYRERCLQQEIADGIADLDAGRVIDGDKVIAELRARLSNANG